jgi:hypothetical protein
MKKREKLIMEVAIEIDRLLTDGVGIHPNSPIHEKLNQALRQPAVSRRNFSSNGMVDITANVAFTNVLTRMDEEKWTTIE